MKFVGRTASLAPTKSAGRALLPDLRQLILAARDQVARTVDTTLVALNWEIGRRIRQNVLSEKRATYGAEIVSTLSRQLEPEFGRGFSDKSLRHMMRFAEVFPDGEIVSALRRQLSWTHFKRLIYLPDLLQREFYAEMCRVERWSTRTLDEKIQSMLFERTALSRKPAKLTQRELARLRRSDRLSPDLVFRDPYVLDFLGLKDTYAERDLEAAIIWAREQNAAGHKLEPRSLAPSFTRPGITVPTENFGQWPVTALLFLDARDLDEATAIAASHPAKDYNVSMEVRPWSQPTPARAQTEQVTTNPH